MKKKEVAKIVNKSKSYIHKIEKGEYENETSKLVKTLLAIDIDNVLKELFINDYTYEVCEVAISKSRNIEVRKHAHQMQIIRDSLIKKLDNNGV